MRAAALALSVTIASMTMPDRADAQTIHRCSIAGRPVIQATPCAAEARPAAPRPAPAAAAIPAPEAPKKRTLADILRERDGASPRQPVMREPQGDGANVLRARMGAV